MAVVNDRLENIIKKTLSAIEAGREEIFNIAEATRNEIQRLSKELSQLRVDITNTINEVDRMRKIEKQLRQRLMEVSKNYTKYSEQEMMRAYAEAKDAQVQLQLLEGLENQLRSRRDDIERTLTQMYATIERAENLMNKVSMAISLLESTLSENAQSKDIEQLQEISLKIIKAQEEERRRVAREIHDGPAQSLANIVLRLEIVEKLLEHDRERAGAELKELKQLVRNNLQDIRRIIFDLRPMALDEEGMVNAICRYLENFQNTYGIDCQIDVKGKERRLNSAIEVTLFRVIQEGMTNIAKHSNSKKAQVLLEFLPDKIMVVIKDYGHGFDVQSAFESSGEHFGLIGMRERIEMISGTMKITSEIDKGTTLELCIPYLQEEER